MNCTSCGADIREGLLFCNKCGSCISQTQDNTNIVSEEKDVIAAEEKICLSCGSMIRAGLKFCNKCGSSVSEMEEKRQAIREAEEKARREAEEKARREAEEKARREAEEKARREAEEKARREAEEKARREAEEKARREAEEKARREAEEKARREAEEKARREAEEKARREAEEKARREAEEKARREAEEKALREAEEKARREAGEKARREAEELEQLRQKLLQSIEHDYNQRLGAVLIKKAQAVWKLKQLENDSVQKEAKVIEKKSKDFTFVPGGTIVGKKNIENHKGVFIEGRTVTLSDFYMGKYEVTQEEYASVMAGQKVTVGGVEYELESNPSLCTEGSTNWILFAGEEQGKRPVEGVTWYDAVWYCNALSTIAGLTPAYTIDVKGVRQARGKTGYYIYNAEVTVNPGATGYRLPTEAEWEYAARGGNPDAEDWNYTFSGADKAAGTSYEDDKNPSLDSVGWYWYNTVNGTTGDVSPSQGGQGYGTHQVGKKVPNKLGLYDMSGNVSEWCYDWNGTINTGVEKDPQDTVWGSHRVVRGGSWYGYSRNCAIFFRNYYGPDFYSSFIGFRVVRGSSK